MEEASVAGESPDRSKQRESSGAPEAGSASPVPEARSEARDPRLAVAQETPAAKRGGVDTATKVFSVRDVPGAQDAQDGRDAHDAADPVTDAEDAPEADENSGAADETAAGAEAQGSEEAAAPEEAEGAAGAGETGEDASGDAGTRRAAVASWVVTAKDAAARNGTKAENADDADDSAAPAGQDDEDAVEDPKARDAGEAPEVAEATEESELGSDEPGADGPDDETDTDDDTASAVDASSDDEPEDAVPEPADPAAPEPEDAEPTPADAAPAAEDDDAEDPTEAEPEDDEPGSQPDSEPQPEDDPAPEPEDEPKSPRSAPPGPAPAVDHPTTVFKAPRPPKPPVDQPTTMLKAPRPPARPTSSAPPAPPSSPAADPERTSRFVALKPLDEPPARPAGAPARSAGAPGWPAGAPGRAATGMPAGIPAAERTTQQPLPPKPPLDLLAELTNTPPPPPTPLRALLRRVKIWTPLAILLAIVFAVVQAVRPLPTPSLALTADDSYTFDGAKAGLPWPSEGQGWMDVDGIGTMDSFGKQTPVAIGSVAKAMTAYVVLKDHPLDPGKDGPGIEVDAKAEKEGGYDKDGESTLNTVKTGDTLTEKDALSAVMIPSANNIARLLARWDAGSEAAFVKKMNATAKELGMTNTTYTDPSGLIETTVSTAQDQVKLGNALVKIPALTDITKLPSWKDPSGQVWQNYNRLVPYNGAIGIKTGSTTKAGGNLLFAATKEVGGETVTLVGAVLGQHTAPIIDTVNAVSKTAMLAAQDGLTSAKILKKGDVVGYVDDQLGGHTPVAVTEDVTAVGWAGLEVRLSFEADDLPHSAKAGTKAGTLTVGDGDAGAVEVPVALEKDLTEPGFGAKLTRVA
jgi:serine-type D-Ala-D-Ala carboxypeptidase (penicillin-binding protein 5/6)